VSYIGKSRTNPSCSSVEERGDIHGKRKNEGACCPGSGKQEPEHEKGQKGGLKMSKKVISIKVIGIIAAFAILIPGLALAGQSSDSLPDPPGLLPGISPDTLSEEIMAHIPEGIYRTGTPDFDKAREFHISQSGDESLFQNYPIIARGYWIDGYYQVTLDEERWDGDLEIVDKLVRELQELGCEDLPIRIAVGTTILLGSRAVEVDEVQATSTEATPAEPVELLKDQGRKDSTGGEA